MLDHSVLGAAFTDDTAQTDAYEAWEAQASAEVG